MKYIVLLLASVCFSLSVIASNPRIIGKVLDSENNVPVDFANVILFVKGNETPVLHTIPEKNGSFSFFNIKNGEYTLLIRAVGYDIYSKTNIILSSSSIVDLGTIEIKPLETGLAEVEIVAQKRQVIYKLDKKVIDASNDMMASGGTAVDILENTPSIRVDAEGGVTFRGSSGFVVYVDGKPSVFSGSQALEQIPSSHIENIEIITTPSARHDTGGNVGIINIITKKHSQKGLSGIINLTGSTILSRGVDFLVTQNNNKSRWYIGGTWNDRLRKSNFDQEKTTIVADTSTVSYSDGPRKSKSAFYSLKAGWLYTLPKTTFNIDLEGGYAGHKRSGDLDYTESRSLLSIGNTLEKGDYISYDDYDLHETFYQGTVGFTQKFNTEGHGLTGSFYLKYGGDAMEYFQSDLFNRQGERQQGHRAWEDEHRWTSRVNLDYVFPYRATGRIESGYQYFSYLEDGDYSMQFWDPDKKEFYWRDDIYNTFYFKYGIHSIYAIVADSYKNFDFQLGLRGEHTHRVLRSSKEWANRTFNHFDLFPSVHLGYNFPNDHKLLASYSRRITRPELFFMEPYITYRDYYSAEIGNPDIRSEYINSFELGYKKNIDVHTLSATGFYRNRKDKIERLRVPYEAGVTLDSMANVGHDYSLGVEINAQIQAAKWWNMNINGSYYKYKVENELKLNGATDSKSNNYEVSFNNILEAAKYTRIQLDGNFVGPSVTTQGKTSSFWYVNLAVRQQLMKRRLAATLSFRDVFNSARYTSNINTSNLKSVTHIRPNYPLITLSLSYTFNNFKGKNTEHRTGHDLFEGTNH
ncbi:MAG: TonB-dependent receptor [Dysgonomonas sp.]|nr:TonB-dependent receptor [Dysgonomonas sp.]